MSDKKNDNVLPQQQGSRNTLATNENRNLKMTKLMNDNEHVKIIPELIMMMLMQWNRKIKKNLEMKKQLWRTI